MRVKGEIALLNVLLHKSRVALGAQLPIRLEADVEARLEEAAKRVGTTKSSIIRMLAKTFVDRCVHEDGTVTLPPNWESLLSSADGRAVRVGKRAAAVLAGDPDQRIASALQKAVEDDSKERPRRPRKRTT